MRSYLSDDEDGAGSSTSQRQRSKKLRSWLDWKEDGKRAYEEGDYKHALESYRTALRPEYECPTKADQAVLWSNVVACRLQLAEGDNNNNTTDLAQARAAVEDAKQCVQLNPNWAKGHVRLASAYIALGGHSNDACNALQSALRIDPGNASAKQMLVRELRRDHAAAFSASTQSGVDDSDANGAGPSSSSSTRDPPNNPSYVPNNSESSPSSTTNSSSGNAGGSANSSSFASSTPPNPNHSVDDGPTWRERVGFQVQRAISWYHNLNSDVKTMFKIGLFILLLYVAFGGRFGFEGSQPLSRNYSSFQTTGNSNRNSYGSNNNNNNNHKKHETTKGNYGSDNAYEQYYRQREHSHHSNTYQQQHHQGSYQRRETAYRDDYDPYDAQDSYYGGRRHSHNGGSWNNFSLSNLFDGSMVSMVLLAGIAYICHLNGINPFQAIMMLNIMAGGRRGGGMYGGYYGGGRRAYGGRRRW